MLSSPCGPAEGAAGGRVGIAIVSATGGGAVGGGCHAGIKVVGSPSLRPASAGGGAAPRAAATWARLVIEPCHGGAGGGGADGAASAPAARSASVDSAAGCGALHAGAPGGLQAAAAGGLHGGGAITGGGAI